MSEGRRPLEFMTVRQVAEAGGISERRVRKLCQSGRLVSMKVGGMWLILEASAYAWLTSDRKPGRPRKGERLQGEQLELDINGKDE